MPVDGTPATLPPPWSAYEAFLLANASQITAVESSLRSITYVLPGRFKDAELCVTALTLADTARASASTPACTC